MNRLCTHYAIDGIPEGTGRKACHDSEACAGGGDSVQCTSVRPLPGPLAQRSELPAHNRLVVGSNPTGPTSRTRGPRTVSPVLGPRVFLHRPLPEPVRRAQIVVRLPAPCFRRRSACADARSGPPPHREPAGRSRIGLAKEGIAAGSTPLDAATMASRVEALLGHFTLRVAGHDRRLPRGAVRRGGPGTPAGRSPSPPGWPPSPPGWPVRLSRVSPRCTWRRGPPR